jgi:hypothetical protein
VGVQMNPAGVLLVRAHFIVPGLALPWDFTSGAHVYYQGFFNLQRAFSVDDLGV